MHVHPVLTNVLLKRVSFCGYIGARWGLANAIFSRAFRESDVHDIIVHVSCVFVRKTGETTSGVLE